MEDPGYLSTNQTMVRVYQLTSAVKEKSNLCGHTLRINAPSVRLFSGYGISSGGCHCHTTIHEIEGQNTVAMLSRGYRTELLST
jgi:hypothetical protein